MASRLVHRQPGRPFTICSEQGAKHEGRVFYLVKDLFSERERVLPSPIHQDFGQHAWGGVVVLLKELMASGALGYRYPQRTAEQALETRRCKPHDFEMAVNAEIPGIWPLDENKVPPTLAVLDLIELCYWAVAKPRGFAGHFVEWDAQAGRTEYCQRINRLFARHGLAYVLQADGRITRTSHEVLHIRLLSARFATGDPILDGLLTSAVEGYLSPDPKTRRAALSVLWDAWERLKTVEKPERMKKKESVEALIGRVAPLDTPLYQVLDTEAKKLTDIGNHFLIRHTEVWCQSVETDEQVDYLFHRMFSLVWYLLRVTGRSN